MDTALSSTTSGPMSFTSEEPEADPEPDPNATYAIVSQFVDNEDDDDIIMMIGTAMKYVGGMS